MTAQTATRIPAAALPPVPGGFGPHGAAWRDVRMVEVPLSPTPFDAQPSAYVRRAWADRTHGVTPLVKVAAAVAGGVLHARLQWEALNPRPAITGNETYADACALLFPLDGESAELATMGDAERPVQGWHWRAGTHDPFVIHASGLGTVTRQPHQAEVSVEAEWSAGSWVVVFSRKFGAAGVPLRPGTEVPLGIAVWQGANEERAGLSSHTPDWIQLDLPGQS